MSQNFDIGSSCIFIQKNGKILIIFSLLFFTFHKIKSRTSIKILRHGSLQMNVLIRHVKFQNCNANIEGDILDQKIKVKKSIFKFPAASLISLLIKPYMTNTSK